MSGVLPRLVSESGRVLPDDAGGCARATRLDMPSQPTSPLLALGDPADAEQRVGLRALLPRLLERPGSLLNPLFLGPVARPEPLREEAERAVQAAGLKLLTVRELGVSAEAVPGLALLTEKEAARVVQLRVRVREGVQVIVWSRRGAAALSDPLREWIATGGMALDPAQELPRPDGHPLALAVAGLACAAPDRCVVRVGSTGALQLLVDETRVRLELAGLGPVEEVAWAADAPLPQHGSVVLPLPGAAGPGGAARAWERARALLDGGCAVVIVTDPTGDAALRLLGPGCAPEGGMRRVWEPGGVEMGALLAWPEQQEMLLAGPETGPAREVLAEFSLRDTRLAEVLHRVALWQQPGTLLIYEQNRLGWMRIAGGELRGARRVQERTEAGTAAEAVSRVRDMSRWRDAVALFLPQTSADGEVGGACRIPLDADALGLSPGLGSGYASREQNAGDVADALLRWGLVDRAARVLERAMRDRDGGVRAMLLLGHFRAAGDPLGALELFRETVRQALARDAGEEEEALAMDAGLNALLVEARAGLRSAARAWTLLEEAGLVLPGALRDDSGRVALVLEIAVRAGRRDLAAELAGWLAARGGHDAAARRMAPIARVLELPAVDATAAAALPVEPDPFGQLPSPAPPAPLQARRTA